MESENQNKDQQQINQSVITPSQPTTTSNSKLKQKLINIFGAILTLLLVGGGAYYLGLSQNISRQEALSSPQTPTSFVQPTLIPTENTYPEWHEYAGQVLSFTKLSEAGKLGTTMYSNSEVEITFEYPSFLNINEIDIQKENADWQAEYKDNPNVKQPLYTSSFAVGFSTPNQELATTQEFCDNKMSVSFSGYDNNKNLSLYDFITDQDKSLSRDRLHASDEKDLQPTSSPKQGSYVFEGIVGSTPMKAVYFTNKSKIYIFSLTGNCDTGGEYTYDAEAVFDNMLKSVKYL
jgi:hypothetical protein